MGIDMDMTLAARAHADMVAQNEALKSAIHGLEATLDGYRGKWEGDDFATYQQVRAAWEDYLVKAEAALAGHGDTLVSNIKTFASASAANSDSFRELGF
ncbi:WXG100 family type VII secretion target [Streptomyces sp. NPDC018057]|uniref:WXG100 family type VII secretion target n=1 Tax=unclassified Streptomyces TaxID=2593676 RepID=UPI00379B1633